LARAINNALTASPDFLEQFVVSEIDRHACGMAGIADAGYSFVSE
jgi:hypothetical protein